jgi:uroporphyrinogen decarboxylase
MNQRERAWRAVHMQGPDRVPLLLFNRDFEQSDLMLIDIVKMWGGEQHNYSEWGFFWKRKDNTMGQPKEALIKNWSDFEKLILPDPNDPSRFQRAKRLMETYGEKYYIASLALSGFTIMTILRGFTNVLEDLYLEPEQLEKLAEAVFGFEMAIIKKCKEYPFDAIGFFDDWGTQNGLIISPEKWREFFKPRYKVQFDLVHSQGMSVYFHSCGQIKEIISDLIEIGVDILNISQPNLYNIEELGRLYMGKVCFVCPVSYQTTSIYGTKEDIWAEAKSMIQSLGNSRGGFIGYVEEYQSIGLSEENYQHCIQAFRELGDLL